MHLGMTVMLRTILKTRTFVNICTSLSRALLTSSVVRQSTCLLGEGRSSSKPCRSMYQMMHRNESKHLESLNVTDRCSWCCPRCPAICTVHPQCPGNDKEHVCNLLGSGCLSLDLKAVFQTVSSAHSNTAIHGFWLGDDGHVLSYVTL